MSLTNTCRFKIASHLVGMTGAAPPDPLFMKIGFGQFLVDFKEEDQPLFTLHLGVKIEPEPIRVLHTFDFEGALCSFSRGGGFFEFSIDRGKEEIPYLLRMPFDSDNYLTNLEAVPEQINELRFTLWMAYGMAALPASTLAIHASTIVYNNRAILFLGESGTGKSTHTQLWLDHLPGSELLNDDSPMIRISDHRTICWGSPWSGKRPCYKNRSYPVAAIVRLEQAPENSIEKLGKVSSFAALFPSCSPSFLKDTDLTDQVCSILSEIIAETPFYKLRCLPDAGAAQLVHKTVFNE